MPFPEGPPPASSVSLVEAAPLLASVLIGDECLLEDTEDTLLRKFRDAECLRLKKAKAADVLRSKLELPEPEPDFLEVMGGSRLHFSFMSPGVLNGSVHSWPRFCYIEAADVPGYVPTIAVGPTPVDAAEK